MLEWHCHKARAGLGPRHARTLQEHPFVNWKEDWTSLERDQETASKG